MYTGYIQLIFPNYKELGAQRSDLYDSYPYITFVSGDLVKPEKVK